MHRDVSMLHACVIKIVAHDHAHGIDAVAVSGSGPGKVHLRENAVLIKESVAVARGIGKAAHNKAQGVDAESF